MEELVVVYRLPEDYVPGSGTTQAAWRTWFESMGAGCWTPVSPQRQP